MVMQGRGEVSSWELRRQVASLRGELNLLRTAPGGMAAIAALTAAVADLEARVSAIEARAAPVTPPGPPGPL